MKGSFAAFADEFVKISQERQDVTKERLIRGAKGALAGGAAAGIGTGLGGLAARALSPKYVPKLSDKNLRLLTTVSTGLGAGAGLLRAMGKSKYRDYVDKDEKRG